MHRDLQVRFPPDKSRDVIVCAHCGQDRGTVHARYPKPYAYISCDCPGHLSTILREFSEMPYLAERLEDFENWLEAEECVNPDKHCVFQSNSRRMCPICRLKLRFFHCIYNAEAYR